MTIEIVPYEARHEAAVRAFNARLAAAAVGSAFPEHHVPPMERLPGSGLWAEYFVATEGDDVRGAYILKHQDFVLDGETVSIGNFGLPISEGTVDRAYALVASQLLLHALRRQPLLYGLGIGGYGEAAARLLASARFGIVTVPFFFRVEHAGRFLREAGVLRTSRLRRLACDLAAVSGAGALGIGMLQAVHAARRPTSAVQVASFDAFGEDADGLWTSCAGSMLLGAVRDRDTLRRLYDAPGNPFIRVRLDAGGELQGWAVCLATRMHDAKYFGNLTVGSIVDGLAMPGLEGPLVRAAVARLREEEVDLIVTNQSLGGMGQALRAAGFLRGPSNFLFAASPRLAARLQPLDTSLARVHLTRGDGDGPINL